MRIVSAFLFTCLLTAIAHVSAGDVKLVDGRKMPKNSVAELDIFQKVGNRFLDTILFVYASQIDTITTSQLHSGGQRKNQGADSVAPASNPLEQLDSALVDFDLAEKVGKVYLAQGRHIIVIKCTGRRSEKSIRRIVYSSPIPLAFDCVAGHRYRLGGKIVRNNWDVWIEDRGTKVRVAGTSPIVE